MLTSPAFGFSPSNITIMIDTDKSTTQPTGKNIKAALANMVKNAQPGDSLVFHFSGHGTQVPTDDPKEEDGKDEAICPTDMNLICDDDLRDLLSPLKPGVMFTFIADCCHSGSLLDHKEVIIKGPKAGGPPPPTVDVQAIQNMLAAMGGKKDLDPNSLAAGNKARSLPYPQLCTMLTSLMGSMGKKEGTGSAVNVGKGNFHESMLALFGNDASKKSAGYVQYAIMGLQMLKQSGMGGENVQNLAGQGLAMLGAPAGKPPGGGKPPAQKQEEPGCMGMLMACLGGGGGGGGGGAAYAVDQQPAPGGAAGGQDPIAAALGAFMGGGGGGAPLFNSAGGNKPPADQQLGDDIGILITGCQSNETSADARPAGGKAHGALSNALTTVVKTHNERSPGVPLTYRNLVISVRQMLAKTGFAQNPCLECSEAHADGPVFVNA